jgi:hypothetical protein
MPFSQKNEHCRKQRAFAGDEERGRRDASVRRIVVRLQFPDSF